MLKHCKDTEGSCQYKCTVMSLNVKFYPDIHVNYRGSVSLPNVEASYIRAEGVLSPPKGLNDDKHSLSTCNRTSKVSFINNCLKFF